MKRLITLSIVITLIACKEKAPKDYVTLSGKIENPHENKTLRVFKGKVFEKIITLGDDGIFKDTLKVDEGDYSLQHGDKYGIMYLKNNNESTLNTNYGDFDKAMVFGGDASDMNNFSVQSYLISRNYFTDELISNGTQKDLDSAIENYRSAYEGLKTKYTEVDSAQVVAMDNNIVGTIQQMRKFLSPKIAMRTLFAKGQTSPTFREYENFSGGNMSLEDLRGKYIYIDVWATWCGPCIREIPSLQKLEKQFEGKNITFVSISVDEGRGYKGNSAEAYKGWKKMIADKNLGGIQLIADNGFRSQFIQDYKINSIPRFLLIDPDGNIVNADAPRPSSSQLVALFNDLNI
ncbi:TlpA family protein disulfide reductase [Winogradskyella sp. UBA3174]|uniref:TlpA family protein disulfide reductase n=1 Tax=Winogradskyella sp. UBA3174 TaxID=1947785 RepID=UPI0025EC6038|nr:TlpA disulfide reductase family protein [Winogradskyella sp. UBA3174]|tara:strand:- start:29520 stop:30560 length:1041 start_codon:yes stop_codon:yes gene_type:complete